MFFLVWSLYLQVQSPSIFEQQRDIYRHYISSNIKSKGYWLSQVRLLAKDLGDEFEERFEGSYDYQINKMIAILDNLGKEQSFEQKLSDANSTTALVFLTAAQFFTDNTDTKPSVYTLYPEKIKAFLADIHYPYKIDDFDKISSPDAKKSDVEYAHFALEAERAIDNYLSDRLEPMAGFNLYYFLMKFMSKSSDRGIFQPRLILLATSPILIAYYLFKIFSSGYIKNIYMLPRKRFCVFLHLFSLTYILVLFFYTVPQIMSCSVAALVGKTYNWNTDMVVIRHGCNTFQSVSLTNNILPSRFIGLSQLPYVPYGEQNAISALNYHDFMSVRFAEFFLRAAVVDFLKITFIVALSTYIILAVMKYRCRMFVIAALSFFIYFFEQRNMRSRFDYINPFALTNGWNIALGTEPYTWLHAIILLTVSILGIVLLAKLTMDRNVRQGMK